MKSSWFVGEGDMPSRGLDSPRRGLLLGLVNLTILIPGCFVLKFGIVNFRGPARTVEGNASSWFGFVGVTLSSRVVPGG